MTKSNTIEVYVCEPHNRQYYKEIPNDIEEMQTLVDGHIQVIPIPPLAKQHIVLVCDEEALLKGNKEQSVWIDTTWILGTCFFAKMKYGNFASLTDKDKKVVEQYMSGELTMTDKDIIQQFENTLRRFEFLKEDSKKHNG